MELKWTSKALSDLARLHQYEMRYEVADEIIYVLRLWHARENRQW
ncbi:hypothetical protein [Desulfuromonas sp. CSMB_57]|jgi:hypothetical protein|nr:hypothetical protein [Desulfuromonas sp. CSMB_57]